ncbi:MAG: hypothetical protein IBJ00_01470 [Alphaproteobacteria bacterium]|nr:hypothetical protein [Alphaproteobacteria bacterium]
MGWSVRLGGVFDLAEPYVSARIISAFQYADRREELIRVMAEREGARAADAIRQRLSEISAKGFDFAASEVAQGVIDVSCPVLDHLGNAVAALTVPYVANPAKSVPVDQLVATVREAGWKISQAIGYAGPLPASFRD